MRANTPASAGGCHVRQPTLQVPPAARKVPIDAAGDVEGAELIVDPRELRRDLGRLSLQQPDRLLGQNMRVNIDGFCGHGGNAHEGRDFRKNRAAG